MLLEKTKGAIKNGKSRTHKTQDEDKQNQKHNTTQKTKKMSNMNPIKNRR